MGEHFYFTFIFLILIIIIGGLLATAKLIEARAIRIERRLKISEEQLSIIFDSSATGMCLLSHDGRFIKINKAIINITGRDETELNKCTMFDIVHLEDTKKLQESITKLIHGQEANLHVELRCIKKNGTQIWVDVSISSVPMDDETYASLQIIDITKRKEDEEKIYKLAYYDTLTNLPNRFHYNKKIKEILDRARKNDKSFAVFLIDLDDFKRVNDTLGHNIGDGLLAQIADKLSKVVDTRCEIEETCNCFVARLGGDEFVLVAEEINSVADAEYVAKSIFKQFESVLIIEDEEIEVSLSIGISLYPYDGFTPASLLKSADLSLYAAKERGKNTYFFHEGSLNARLEERTYYESALRYFIDTGDFELYYQPFIHIDTTEICGVEVLFRGNTHKYPNIQLNKLIDYAEFTKLIIPLGRLILKKTMHQYMEHIEEYKDCLILSVNVSIFQLRDPNFVNVIINTAQECKFPLENLAVEITETIFAKEFSEMVSKLKELRKYGVIFSIDDFGKGYSSMSYIHHLPVDKIKIDMSFVHNITTDVKSFQIIKAIVALGKNLDLVVLAEGVETVEQLEALSLLGVDQVQGFYTGRPVPIDDIVKKIKENNICYLRKKSSRFTD